MKAIFPDDHRCPRRETVAAPRFHVAHRHGFRTVAMICLAAVVAALALGCGNGSSKPQVSEAKNRADSEPADPPQEEAPAPKPVAKKFKVAPKSAEPDLAPLPSKDPRQWKIADLQRAISRKDPMFSLAAFMYGSKPNDSKRAGELDALLGQIAKMSDDANITVPIAASSAPTPGGAGPTSPFMPPAATPSGDQGSNRKVGGRKRNKRDD
jgi:hypothetical protein